MVGALINRKLLLHRTFKQQFVLRRIASKKSDNGSIVTETPDEFSESYSLAHDSLSENVTNDQKLLKNIMRQLSITKYPTKTSWKGAFENLTGEPLVDSLFVEDTNFLYNGKDDEPTNLELRQRLIYNILLDLEIPGHRTLPFKNFNEFIKDSKLKNEALESIILGKGKMDAKFLLRLLLIWNEKVRSGKKHANKQLERQKNLEKLIEEKKSSGPRRTVLGYMKTSRLNSFFEDRVLRRKEFSQPLIIDMRFSSTQNNKIAHTITQLGGVYSLNRAIPNPFNLVFSNFQKDTEFNRRFFQSGWSKEACTITSKSYLELEPMVNKEQLVYLSPDAEKEMTTFDFNKVYIIGGLVDRHLTESLTKTIAFNESIACERLPLQKYLEWGGITGRKDLNIITVFEILSTLKATGCWVQALDRIPKRFYTGLSMYGKHYVNYDQDVIDHFSTGLNMYEKKKLSFKKGTHSFTTLSEYFRG